jgi:hypothetical protein
MNAQLTKQSHLTPMAWRLFSKSIVFCPSSPRLNEIVDFVQLSLEWDDSRVHSVEEIKGKLSYGGRGMELSTLNKFNGHLYACDDKTGIVFDLEISDSMHISPIPWVILADGNFTGPTGRFFQNMYRRQ